MVNAKGNISVIFGPSNCVWIHLRFGLLHQEVCGIVL